MGLKKPVKTGPDLPSLDEIIGVDVEPVETDGYIVLDTVPGQACTLESNTPISIKAELGKFGDANAADVVSGKTFTSAAGLKVAGTGNMGKVTTLNSTSQTINLGTINPAKTYAVYCYSLSGYCCGIIQNGGVVKTTASNFSLKITDGVAKITDTKSTGLNATVYIVEA